jgi:hypothetical protein
MKIKVERLNNILKLPAEAAFLEGISDDGKYYKYRIRYQADIERAIKNKAINVIIRILKDETRTEKFNIFVASQNNNDNIIKNLLLQKPLQKDLSRSKGFQVLFATNSDLSKKIPNDQIKLISSVPNSGKRIKKYIKNKVQRVDDIKNSNVVRPVLETNLIAFKDKLGITQKQFKDNLKIILRTTKTEPALFLGSKSRSIISSNRAFTGIINKRPELVKAISQQNRKFELVKENLLSVSNILNTSELPNTEYMNYTEADFDDFVTVDEIIQVPVESLRQTNFILELELFNNKKLSQQVISSRINHQEKLDDLLIPYLAPSVKSSPIHKPGKVTLLLKQTDDNCNKINLYKKIVPTDRINLDSSFSFVKSVYIKKSDGAMPVVDTHASSNPTIYRAVSVGKNGVLGFEFDSVVINQDSQKTRIKNQKINKKDTVLTLTHQIFNGFIKLFVTNIPSEPIALEFFRKDLSLNERTGTRISNRILLNSDNNSKITFEDRSAKKDRIYEYYCVLIYKDGDEEVAKNNLIVKYETIESNVATVSVTTPVISETNLDVSFNIVKDISSKNIDIVKKLLTEQNILDEYQDDITNEKEKLQELFIVRILRTNLETGEIEDFGIIDSLEFSDRKFGRNKNVKPLEAGIEYEYTIMVYSIASEILLEKYTRSVAYKNTSYDLLPSKWLHPLTLKQGNLTTQITAKTRHANSVFTFGKVVDIQYVGINLKDVLPKIDSVKAKTIGLNKALIKWKITGNPNKIDHFIITLESLGSRTIVGKSHNISSTNDFQFVDILDNGEHGALKYIITPIYFDYSQGSEVTTNTIFI